MSYHFSNDTRLAKCSRRLCDSAGSFAYDRQVSWKRQSHCDTSTRAYQHSTQPANFRMGGNLCDRRAILASLSMVSVLMRVPCSDAFELSSLEEAGQQQLPKSKGTLAVSDDANLPATFSDSNRIPRVKLHDSSICSPFPLSMSPELWSVTSEVAMECSDHATSAWTCSIVTVGWKQLTVCLQEVWNLVSHPLWTEVWKLQL